MGKQYIVRVPAATIWTSPESPRAIDEKAVSYPLNIRGWLAEMETADRKELTESNLVQTQVLFGDIVTLIEEKDGWLHVSIPGQPSSKLDAGYPGWLPKKQVIALEEVEGSGDETKKKVAAVTSPTAVLQLEDGSLEVSFQTVLPVVSATDDTVNVQTPLGDGILKRADVEVIEAAFAGSKLESGEVLVKTAEKFLSLPYLWGGMSGFGFDCSGLTATVHKAYGITIPRDAFDQAESGEKVKRGSMKPGDCIYFAKEAGTGRVYHVGMYYGDGKMIHAPSAGKGIEIVPLSTTKYDKDYFCARRYWK